jgi:diaminohydroxyphosphoribosylaminopyrimidine deaminase/5-amino-6-(5-phosphoribosylamino)uracil reductase
MRAALQAAEAGHGCVSPNPPVGCVLVKDGTVVATGWHAKIGDLHAEQAAIADAEERGVPTAGCVAYVTLEPCNHHGRTPPCTQALLWAGVSEVVIATRDLNPMVRGLGVEALVEAGIPVRVGCLEVEAKGQMQAFMRWCQKKRPIVTLKIAVDANGVIDSNEKSSSRFTSEESLILAHKLRRFCDAIVVGINTVLRDNPALTIRKIPLKGAEQPIRVILDSSLKTLSMTPSGGEISHPKNSDGGGTTGGDEGGTRDVESGVEDSIRDVEGIVEGSVQGGGGSNNSWKILDETAPTLLVHSGDREGSGLVSLPANQAGIELEALLDMLGDRGFQEVLIEGGAKVWKSFIEANLVDRVVLIQAPVILGEGPTLGFDSTHLEKAGLNLDHSFKCGQDSVEAWSIPELGWPSTDLF